MAKKSEASAFIEPEHFSHSVLLAFSVMLSALLYTYISMGGVLALGSIIASMIILLHKHRHHLTSAGTVMFAYFISAVLSVGIITALTRLDTPIESQAIICVVLVGIALHWLGIFHSPALVFGASFLGFKLGIIQYAITFFGSMLCFFLTRLAVYLAYEHLSFENFIHEFVREEKELLRAEEKRIIKKLNKSK